MLKMKTERSIEEAAIAQVNKLLIEFVHFNAVGRLLSKKGKLQPGT